MIKLFKKLSRWINSKLYLRYMKKARKRFCKLIGARKYRASKIEKLCINNEKDLKHMMNAFYGESCYADTDSVSSIDTSSLYPNVMRTGVFPATDRDKKSSEAEDKEWGTLEERGIVSDN